MESLILRGPVWDAKAGATAAAEVGIDADGVIAFVGQTRSESDPARLINGAWVGPALIDAHVHLAFGSPAEALAGCLGAVRDLGSCLADALDWRTEPAPVVAVTGELLTSPNGYPTQSWGAGGFGWPVADSGEAGAAVERLADAGVDLIKLALEPGGGPVPDAATCRSVVDAAHGRDLAVTCHALSEAMVVRALDAGVDELAHTPTELLSPEVVERIAAAAIPVISTLHTHAQSGAEVAVTANARALVRAGAALVYGTDLGNAATTPGVSVAELERLADSGLGRLGALRSATTAAVGLPGFRGRVDLEVARGARTVLVVLDADPLIDPTSWERPLAVVSAGRVVAGRESLG